VGKSQWHGAAFGGDTGTEPDRLDSRSRLGREAGGSPKVGGSRFSSSPFMGSGQLSMINCQLGRRGWSGMLLPDGLGGRDFRLTRRVNRSNI
jgi:hypothetical protein